MCANCIAMEFHPHPEGHVYSIVAIVPGNQLEANFHSVRIVYNYLST